MTTKKTAHDGGSALIAVLCIMTLMSLLAASAVTMSQLSNHFSKVVSERGLSVYHAEGAAARMCWLVLADKKANGANADMWNFDYSQVDGERYLPDGTTKKFVYYQADAEVKIEDMACGIDVSGKTPTKNLRRDQSTFEGEDMKTYDDYLAFIDAVADYVDSDDFVRSHGAEKSDYEELGMPNLPRNDQMQFREEMTFIPGASTFFTPDEYGRLSCFRLIPMKKMKSKGVVRKKDSFFGVDENQLLMDGFPPDVAKQVIEARNRWYKEQGLLSQVLMESVAPEFVSKLRGKYSFSASGFYNFVIKVTPERGKASRTLFFSLQLGYQPSDNKKLNYYDWMIL